MKVIKLIGLIIGLMMLSGVGVWSTDYGISEKISLENSISKRVEEIVVKMIGDKRVIVIVNIEHNTTIEQEIKGMSTTKKASGGAIAEGKKDNYLPGIPVDAVGSDILGESGSRYSQTIRLPQFIKKMSVTIIVNDTVTDEVLNNVKGYLGGLLNLDFGRGDRLEVKKMNFATDRDEMALFLRNSIVPILPWVIGVIVLIIFIFGPLGNFMKKAIAAIEVLRVQADTRVTNKNEGDMKGNMPMRGLGGDVVEGRGQVLSANQKKSLEEGRHFDFINESNVGSLQYLLKGERAELIAIVMTYLPKEYSSRIIDVLPYELRVETLKLMAKTTQYRAEDIKLIEDKIRERVNYLLGGPQVIADIINLYDTGVRSKILTEIGTEDPAIVSEIMRTLVTIEDIKKLSKEHVNEIYRYVGARLFAAAVSDVNGGAKEHVMESLTEGARGMLQQEIDLISNNLPVWRRNQAKKDLINAMKTLESQGTIKIPREAENQ